MKLTPPFDLAIGLDRSDRKADLHLIDQHTGAEVRAVIDTSPEALQAWAQALHAAHPTSRVAICFEEPANNLIAFLARYDWITLYPINPIRVQKFRESFVVSRAKDDGKDAEYLARYLTAHHDQLTPWRPDTPQTRLLERLVVDRRSVVDHRTQLGNRLQALLKDYFPQALDLVGEDLWRPWPRPCSAAGPPCRRSRKPSPRPSASSTSPRAPAIPSSSSNAWTASPRPCP